ncbi:hypothetical protein M8818_002417 [Zalaria obscura]|uniref:Uncharacterized protein n=1 Tax=Zalaria obscura TaxID=2024903 RepID=A0ACC3SM68_9PEZI
MTRLDSLGFGSSVLSTGLKLGSHSPRASVGLSAGLPLPWSRYPWDLKAGGKFVTLHADFMVSVSPFPFHCFLGFVCGDAYELGDARTDAMLSCLEIRHAHICV